MSLGKPCISSFNSLSNPCSPLTTSSPACWLQPDAPSVPGLLPAALCCLVHCTPSTSTTKPPWFHPALQLSCIPPCPLPHDFSDTRSCCRIRIANLLPLSSGPQVLCPNYWHTVNKSQCRLIPFSSFAAFLSLPHCLEENAILCITQPQSIFKLEREMVKQIEREKVDRKIETEACYPSSPRRFTSESLIWKPTLLITCLIQMSSRYFSVKRHHLE